MALQKELIQSELLLLQHRRGDPSALERLVELWDRPVYYYVRRLVREEDLAKDIAQDVWVTVFRRIRGVRDPAAFPAWLFRVARNRIASHFRKAPPWNDVLAENEEAHFVGEDGRLPAMDAEELHWALGQLNPLHSECVILHYLEGFTLEEVSGITDAPLGTVKSRLHYAKKVLRELLNKEAARDGSE